MRALILSMALVLSACGAGGGGNGDGTDDGNGSSNGDDTVDTGDTGDTGDTDDTGLPPPVIPPDRVGVTSGGSTTRAGGGYKLRLSIGDPTTSEELFDGENVLRVGVGTTQDGRP